MDFGPVVCPPLTFARLQSRFDFVELGGDMYSNYQGEVAAVTGMTGWYHLIPRTMHGSTVYMYENIGYVQPLVECV